MILAYGDYSKSQMRLKLKSLKKHYGPAGAQVGRQHFWWSPQGFFKPQASYF